MRIAKVRTHGVMSSSRSKKVRGGRKLGYGLAERDTDALGSPSIVNFVAVMLIAGCSNRLLVVGRRARRGR